jgi:hypothetical protein
VSEETHPAEIKEITEMMPGSQKPRHREKTKEKLTRNTENPLGLTGRPETA